MLHWDTTLFPASRRRDTVIVLQIGRWWKAWTFSRPMAPR